MFDDFIEAVTQLHQELVPEYSDDNFFLCFVVTVIVQLKQRFPYWNTETLLFKVFHEDGLNHEVTALLRRENLLEDGGQLKPRAYELDLTLLHPQALDFLI